MGKRLISIIVCMVLVASSLLPTTRAAGPFFSDVPESHWAYSYINEMAELGIVNGMGDGKFDPNGEVTTAQFITMLVREFYPNELAKYQDGYVWYDKYIRCAQDVGMLRSCDANYSYDIVDGKKVWAAKFIENDIPRKEMVKMIFNILIEKAELPENWFEFDIIFDGSDRSSWFQQSAIGVAAHFEIMRTIGGGNPDCFYGTLTGTRAQACAIISRTRNAIKENPVVNNGDTNYLQRCFDEEHKSYSYIVEKGYKYSDVVELRNGKELTEENVYEALMALQSKYPNGMTWDYDSNYTDVDGNYYEACEAFRSIIYDEVFRDINRDIDLKFSSAWNGYTTTDTIEFYPHTDVSVRLLDAERIKPGSLLILNNDHTATVLKVEDGKIYLVEGNVNGKVRWNTYIDLKKPNFTLVTVYVMY